MTGENPKMNEIKTTALKTTPLLERHKALGARIGPFGGWLMPIQYPEGIIAEHLWTRKSVSLFDICHMGEFFISGDPSKNGLDRIVTQGLASMRDGSCRYGFMLDGSGGIIDDVVVYKIGKEEWMLVVNAATIEGDEAHLRENLRIAGCLENKSDITGKLDLQGPASLSVLKKIVKEEIGKLSYYSFGMFSLLGEKVTISRTGYTGELGYEIYISDKNVGKLWDLLLDDSIVKPAGLGSRDTLRLEMCYPLYGQDIDRSTSPVEAGFDRFIDFKKDFIGKESVLKKKAADPGRRLVAFMSETRRSPRHNHKIFISGKEAGVVTSGSFSPSLGLGIGMGFVDKGFDAMPGCNIRTGDEASSIDAVICDRPFYKKGSARG